MSHHWKNAAESALADLGHISDLCVAESGLLQRGFLSGPHNSGSAHDSMTKATTEVQYRSSKVTQTLIAIHDSPMSCVPGRCVVCLLLQGVESLKIAVAVFERVIDRYKKARASFRVHSDDLCAEYRSFLDIARTEVKYLTWAATFVKASNVSHQIELAIRNALTQPSPSPERRRGILSLRHAAAAATALPLWLLPGRSSLNSPHLGAKRLDAKDVARRSRGPQPQPVIGVRSNHLALWLDPVRLPPHYRLNHLNAHERGLVIDPKNRGGGDQRTQAASQN